ncbi:DEAD/DEAH box helicase [Moritella viscosa]|uniref:DEAD/DEAH box helicase n=1 Tax=Moritella viscosa TaxID=80854 RepID=UPI00091953DC|nr:AAA domain-containing protein [Moritella viscosa]SGZ09231.1 Probable helicase [Moritella viscosa]
MSLKLVLTELRELIQREYDANQAKLIEVWEKSIKQKIKSGESQLITHITVKGNGYVELTLGEGESRFREGDMICLHLGDAIGSTFINQASIDDEYDGRWLISGYKLDLNALKQAKMPCYADPDGMNLKPFYDQALAELAETSIGLDIVLPLLAGDLKIDGIYEDEYQEAADKAELAGLNDKQADAVGNAFAAQYLACIQGPPGTGKTKVISCITKLLVERNERVFITSHTHMAINNALNKIAKEGIACIKVGGDNSKKGLDNVDCFGYADDWEGRPDKGYVIGATPFATCSKRLDQYEFDTVIFDEASQITTPLAVMAMRKAKRYIFVGDHKQLPPVILSKSVLESDNDSIFSRLINAPKVLETMLSDTYRMNKYLSKWPSLALYGGALKSEGPNKDRLLELPKIPENYKNVLSSDIPFVYIKSPSHDAKTSNRSEAKLVADIIKYAVSSGLTPDKIGVVSPYRNHGKVIKTELLKVMPENKAKEIVTDTVERMQGQEREMIIISLCTTDVQFLTSVASFFFQPERLNVAISRPMTKLILIGPFLSDNLVAELVSNPKEKTINDNVQLYQSLLKAATHLTEKEF